MCMGCCGIGWGCSARHEGLVVPARLVESAVGICAEMSVVVLHDQLVGVPVGVGCSRPSVVGRPVVRAGPSGQQQQQAKAEHVGGEERCEPKLDEGLASCYPLSRLLSESPGIARVAGVAG